MRKPAKTVYIGSNIFCNTIAKTSTTDWLAMSVPFGKLFKWARPEIQSCNSSLMSRNIQPQIKLEYNIILATVLREELQKVERLTAALWLNKKLCFRDCFCCWSCWYLIQIEFQLPCENWIIRYFLSIEITAPYWDYAFSLLKPFLKSFCYPNSKLFFKCIFGW